jgi:hypothetical protein
VVLTSVTGREAAAGGLGQRTRGQRPKRPRKLEAPPTAPKADAPPVRTRNLRLGPWWKALTMFVGSRRGPENAESIR